MERNPEVQEQEHTATDCARWLLGPRVPSCSPPPTKHCQVPPPCYRTSGDCLALSPTTCCCRIRIREEPGTEYPQLGATFYLARQTGNKNTWVIVGGVFYFVSCPWRRGSLSWCAAGGPEGKLEFFKIHYTSMLQNARIQKSAILDLSRSCINQWEMHLSQIYIIVVFGEFSLKIRTWKKWFYKKAWKIQAIQEKARKLRAIQVFTRFYLVFPIKSSYFINKYSNLKSGMAVWLCFF